MNEAQDKILSVVDDIILENENICNCLKYGIIPKCEKPYYKKKLKSNNTAILKLMQAVEYLESEEYQ